MSLNYVSVDKRVGCSPVSPSPGNFSPFCRNTWRCGDILSAAQSTVQRHYDCGTHHDQAVHVHPMPFSHFTFGGLLPLYRYFSARCAMRALSTLYQPVPHVHGVSCCRSDAECQSRPEVVARTGFHELARGLAQYLTGATSVCCQMDFGAKTAARAPQPIISVDIGMFLGSTLKMENIPR